VAHVPAGAGAVVEEVDLQNGVWGEAPRSVSVTYAGSGGDGGGDDEAALRRRYCWGPHQPDFAGRIGVQGRGAASCQGGRPAGGNLPPPPSASPPPPPPALPRCMGLTPTSIASLPSLLVLAQGVAASPSQSGASCCCCCCCVSPRGRLRVTRARWLLPCPHRPHADEGARQGCAVRSSQSQGQTPFLALLQQRRVWWEASAAAGAPPFAASQAQRHPPPQSNAAWGSRTACWQSQRPPQRQAAIAAALSSLRGSHSRCREKGRPREVQQPAEGGDRSSEDPCCCGPGGVGCCRQPAQAPRHLHQQQL